VQGSIDGVLDMPVKYFLAEISVRAYLPMDIEMDPEDRPRTFMVLSSRGSFLVRTGTCPLPVVFPPCFANSV
jgi:hypothetical protein